MKDFLIDPCLRITPSSCQNDPFECSYTIDDLKNHDVESLRSFSNLHGIISLSSTHESIAMWSHYTDNHKGFVVTIDVDMDVPNELFYNSLISKKHPEHADFLFDKVNYTTQRSYPKNIVSLDGDQIKKHYYFTKSDEWEKEEEYRFIVPFNCVNRILLKKSFLNNNPNILLFFKDNIFELNESYWEVKEEYVFIMVMQFYELKKLWGESSEDNVIFLIRLNSGVPGYKSSPIRGLYLGCKTDKTDVISKFEEIELEDNPCNITSNYMHVFTGELHSIKYGKENYNQYKISFDELKHNFYKSE
jgi:hypothetical protein